MYKTIFNKHNSLKFNRFSNKNYSLFAVLTKNRSRGTSKAQELPSAHFVLHYNPPFHTVAAPFAAAFGDWLGDFAPFADLYNTLFG